MTTYALDLAPWVGGYPGMPASRAYVAQFRGLGALVAHPPGAVSVTVNGVPVPYDVGGGAPGWRVLPAANGTLAAPQGALEVQAGRFAAVQDVRVQVTVPVTGRE